MTPTDEIAEDLQGFANAGPEVLREDVGWAILTHRPGQHPLLGTATHIRAESLDVDEMVRHATRWFEARGRSAFTWMLGPSTRPASLVDDLRAGGAIEDEPVKAMVLRQAPPAVDGIEVRVVANADEFAVWRNIAFEMEDQPASVREKFARGRDAAWASYEADGDSTAYLSFHDGRPAAAGMLQLTAHPEVAAFQASAALREARGNGCYRALVRARYEHALSIGRPVVVTQASPRSRPILERLGFEVVGDVVMLRQSTTA